ncbi:PH domain-containing protein [Timonella sp. A28]|uniref:PH domain-containing protein n=1 Tax=Timonella sp. A28 TaxID=3442640 RepID=UPI003EBE8DD8
MGPTEIFRPTFSRILAYALWALLAFIAVSAVIGTDGTLRLRTIAGCLFVSVAVWLFYFRPYLEISDGGVHIVNPLRTVHIPWPAVKETYIRGSFHVSTTGETVHSAYAATIQNKRNNLGLAGEAKQVSDARFDALADAGFLDDVRPEGAPVKQTWFSNGVIALSASFALLLVTFVI